MKYKYKKKAVSMKTKLIALESFGVHAKRNFFIKLDVGGI